MANAGINLHSGGAGAVPGMDFEKKLQLSCGMMPESTGATFQRIPRRRN